MGEFGDNHFDEIDAVRWSKMFDLALSVPSLIELIIGSDATMCGVGQQCCNSIAFLSHDGGLFETSQLLASRCVMDGESLIKLFQKTLRQTNGLYNMGLDGLRPVCLANLIVAASGHKTLFDLSAVKRRTSELMQSLTGGAVEIFNGVWVHVIAERTLELRYWGAGMQQALLMGAALSLMEGGRVGTLLLDEPGTSWHPCLHEVLRQRLLGMSCSTVVVATHEPTFIELRGNRRRTSNVLRFSGDPRNPVEYESFLCLKESHVPAFQHLLFSSRAVVVEGKTDFRFVSALLRHIAPLVAVSVVDAGGKGNMLPLLRHALKLRGLHVVVLGDFDFLCSGTLTKQALWHEILSKPTEFWTHCSAFHGLPVSDVKALQSSVVADPTNMWRYISNTLQTTGCFLWPPEGSATHFGDFEWLVGGTRCKLANQSKSNCADEDESEFEAAVIQLLAASATSTQRAAMQQFEAFLKSRLKL